MDVNEVLQIVHQEGLYAPVLYGKGCLRNDAVVLEGDGELWRVYLVDDRHTIIESTYRTYGNESDALDRVVLKLRQVKEARLAMQRLAGRVTVSEAITLFLKKFPGRNDDEFLAAVESDETRAAVEGILQEASKIQIEWGEKTLVEIGREVREVMHERHPYLSDAALKKLGYYFTYLVK